MCAVSGLLQMVTPLLNQPRSHQLDGQHTVQHDLWISRKDLVCPYAQRLGDREGAF
jgi:hypothetical protein